MSGLFWKNERMNTPWRQNKRLWLSIVIFVLLGFFAASYWRGVRISGVKLVTAGAITLGELEQGQKIFIDNSRVDTVKSSSEKTFKNYKPGLHTVIVARDGYWPWTKKVEIKEARTVTIKPFLLPQNGSGMIVTDKDPEYRKLRDAVLAARLPEAERPQTSLDNRTRVWSDGLKIYAASQNPTAPFYFCEPTCEEVMTILDSKEAITNVDFLPGRNDVIIFSNETGIYALELDRRSPQNFQPLYPASGARFSIIDGEIYIVTSDEMLLNIFIKVNG